jgi:hypothetical protein
MIKASILTSIVQFSRTHTLTLNVPQNSADFSQVIDFENLDNSLLGAAKSGNGIDASTQQVQN